MNNEKMIKTAETADTVIRILGKVMLGFMIACGVMLVLALTLKEKALSSMVDSSSVRLGEMTLRFADGAAFDAAAQRGSITLMLLTAIGSLAVGFILLRIVREILAPVKAGRPFEAGIADKIKKLGIVTLVGGGLIEILSAVTTVLELRAFDFDTIFNPQTVSSFEIGIEINGTFIIAGLLLLFLSWIFRYGESLQKEADETL